MVPVFPGRKQRASAPPSTNAFQPLEGPRVPIIDDDRMEQPDNVSFVLISFQTGGDRCCGNMFFVWGVFLALSCLLSSGCSETLHRGANLPDRTESPFSCDNDSQCQSLIVNSECIGGICKCPNDLLLSSDGAKCLVKIREYGSACEDNVQCSHGLSSGGVCEENTCKCKSGFHYLKGFCWKNSNLKESCARNEQCFSSYEYIGLRCDEGVCKCRPKYYERQGFHCRRERFEGDSCNLDSDCIDGSVCESSKCLKGEEEREREVTSSNATVGGRTGYLDCPKGMFELNGQCVLELGMECSTDSECSHIENAYCLDESVCGCEPARFVASENNRECLKSAKGKTGEVTSTSCKKDPQCAVFGENSFCKNKRCTCKNGSYWVRSSALCWPIKKLGETCVTSTDCNPDETQAECVNNVCACNAGFHPKETVCVPDAVGVGDSCETDADCLFENSLCNSSQVCQCHESFFPENRKCVPGVETPCNASADCAHLKNTECKRGNLMEKQCLCLDGHSRSEDHKYCLPEMNLKEKCLESFQCKSLLGDFGECIDNLCQCPKKTHYSYGKCHLSKFIGERCSLLPECFSSDDTDSVICLKGFCSCNFGYGPNEAGICVKTNSGAALIFGSISVLSAAIFLTLKI